jgi:CMP-N,N'-diacetyllegionaminic acid synthase
MLIIAIIPARGGSGELPRKNLRRIAGEPMIAHTIRAALGARRVDRTIVSTDDPNIARIARDYGAEVPFERPGELAQDRTPTLPVIVHAVEEVEAAGNPVSVVVTLQPTSPLRGSAEIDAAIELMERSGARSAVAVAEVGLPASTLGAVVDGRFVALPMPAGADQRRQAAAPGVRITGAIYVTRRDLLAEGRLLDEAPVAVVSRGAAAIDIDDLRSLRAARRAADRR